jgi:hypothetical protein
MFVQCSWQRWAATPWLQVRRAGSGQWRRKTWNDTAADPHHGAVSRLGRTALWRHGDVPTGLEHRSHAARHYGIAGAS